MDMIDGNGCIVGRVECDLVKWNKEIVEGEGGLFMWLRSEIYEYNRMNVDRIWEFGELG